MKEKRKMAKTDKRTVSAVTLGVFIIALAVALVAYNLMNKGVLVIVWITALIFGIALCFLSNLYESSERRDEPSEGTYRLAMGAVTALIGIVGLCGTMGLELIYTAVILLIGIALIGITVALMNMKRSV